MTYCVGLSLDHGMIFASDSRTNAGIDNISRYGKMRIFAEEGDRVIVTLSAGNLSISQGAINLLEQNAAHNPDAPNLMTVESMFDAATLVGDAMREVRARDEEHMRKSKINPNASFILGGQIGSEPPRLFLVYSEGNFIESSPDAPFFQTGETKFGKPILDRVITLQTPLVDAAKCVLVSFDSTIRSNLSVGPPIDILTYRRGSLTIESQRRLEEDDPYLSEISKLWNDALRKALDELPSPEWVHD